MISIIERKLTSTIALIQATPKSFVVCITHLIMLILLLFMNDLGYEGKAALFTFLSAMILWITTKIPAGFIALSHTMFIILLNAAEPELLYHSLAEEVVWLMVGSFIIGAAAKDSGITARWTNVLLKRSRNKSAVLYGLSSLLAATAFFIPSTSGRAALSLPILQQLGGPFSKIEQKVLTILAPVVILMSTSATLIGAGSHLIGIGLLESTTGQSISYTQWFVWGVPFTLVITACTVCIIEWVLWPKDIIQEENPSQQAQAHDKAVPPLNDQEKKMLILIPLLIIGWITESIHGFDIAFVTMAGALFVMMPKYGVIGWKEGMKSVSLSLILFVACATALGHVLMDTGVITWLEHRMMNSLHLFAEAPEWLIVLMILLITVTSHLYITSHTTRAIVFIPSLLLFSESMGLNPAATVFLSLVGLNYCVTFPVSSKALLLFYEENEASYDARQLLRISLFLMPIYILIMMLFYFTYWQWTGLSL
ncbi:SLC13 family permease [Paenibacillus shunpengii]|uniref:SLC13 family permease n=1 Tax=Paenibacillus shunpengii TaxID=2054424 RepID=A0ABW5STJ4_9BACL